MASASAPLFKFTVFIYKKDCVPYDKFVKWATEDYPRKPVPCLPNGPAQVDRLDYDIAMTYYVDSLDKVKAMTTSLEWAELKTGYAANGNVDIGHFVVVHEKILFKDNA
ncbi:hypothetical protein B0T26DRAFT_754627 [Lasiosphaeria miniovina]|uniref:EthD domain-containing protein n=1 Tax=Lasiosphaeria miniovina TaxID=1954250 RepID=A0AA40DN90_9PEZI|nr:uncharacterized protein B0T26DRAFT_754627 [Lasiosphaeria miniovina]KAK0709415.1 hypothetical protein B0T26DRAFT_754627 [Lasiosphaeria miniovina]